jgi:hypothetical protein
MQSQRTGFLRLRRSRHQNYIEEFEVKCDKKILIILVRFLAKGCLKAKINNCYKYLEFLQTDSIVRFAT